MRNGKCGNERHNLHDIVLKVNEQYKVGGMQTTVSYKNTESTNYQNE